MTPDDRRNALRDMLNRHARRGTFTLSSGKTSDFYLDGRLVSLAADGMPLIGRVINDMIADDEAVSAIGGPTMGADPIAAAACVIASVEYNRQYDSFIVRKEAKSYGGGKQIEGPALTADSRVILVEDVVTTGGSVLRAVEAVKATGATVLRVIPLLDREEGAAEAFAEAGVKLTPVLRRSEL